MNIEMEEGKTILLENVWYFDNSLRTFQLLIICGGVASTPLLFLAANSSSRSDYVTKFILPSVCSSLPDDSQDFLQLKPYYDKQ